MTDAKIKSEAKKISKVKKDNIIDRINICPRKIPYSFKLELLEYLIQNKNILEDIEKE